jgi:hypothetical protein
MEPSTPKRCFGDNLKLLAFRDSLTAGIAISRTTCAHVTPTPDDFIVTPTQGTIPINVKNKMVVITHAGESAAIDREGARQEAETLHQPATAVIKVVPGKLVCSTQKRPADAAGYDVIVGCGR